MEGYELTCTQKKKVSKKVKFKKNPLKVVYISSPMNFKTSASDFRALVQELTGQDAEWPPDRTRFSNLNVREYVGDESHRASSAIEDDDHEDHDHGSTHTLDGMTRLEELGEAKQQFAGTPSELFDPLDEFIEPHIMENFLDILPGTVFYESAPLEHICSSKLV